MNEVKIENVGPISSLSIPIPAGGGVVELLSRNGAGKSTALRAVEQLTGRPQKTEALSVRDGELQGLIAGLGRSIRVSLTRRTASGDLEAEVLNAEVDPSVLVDPGIVDPEAADARRIAVLCRLAGVPADPTLFPEDLQEHVPERAKAVSDLPEMVALTRRWLQAKAKEQEDAAVKAQADYNAAMAAVGDTPLEGPGVEAVRDAFQQASMEAALRAREAEAYQRAARITAAANENLSPWDPAEEARLAQLEQAEAAEVVQLRQMLHDGELRAQERAAHLREYKNRRLAWERARAARAELEAMPAPTAEEVQEAATRVQELTGELQAAQRREDAIRARARAVQAAERAQEATFEAKQLREKADRCDLVVAQAIARVAPMGLGVDHGRLVLVEDGKKTLWATLSHGQRWRIALECAIAAVGRGGLLPIRQEAWEGLDKDNREAVAALARDRGVVVVTARATSGDLQAVVVGEEVSRG